VKWRTALICFGTGASKPGELPPPWQQEDVGSVSLPGSADWAWSKLQVRSLNQYCCGQRRVPVCLQTVRGNSEIVARVLHVRTADPWAKAGLMMRASLAADAPNLLWEWLASRIPPVAVRERRPIRGGPRSGIAPALLAKLKRDGEDFTAFMSRDGRQWMATENCM
jgi:hypothetical protein